MLSPLRSVTEPASLARSVAEWIVSTIASGCQVHVVEEGQITKLVDVGVGAGPGPGTLAEVSAAWNPRLVRDRTQSGTWAVLPLRAASHTVGTLSVLVDCSPDGLEPSHHGGLAMVASILARALSEAASQRRANDVSQALQESLLPNALPEGDWFDLFARYLPGTADLRIGGDWYDSQVMPDGSIALGVGDVAGHGVDAAAQMGELRSAMIALRLVRSAPDDLISVVHRLTSDMSYFATVVCARLDPTGNLQWASAGHLPPLVLHESGEAELLDTDQSPPLGVGYARRVPLNRYRLSPGDIVLIYTDGLIERRDITILEALERLAVSAARHSHQPIEALIDNLVKERDHPLSTGDDVAILAARWRAEPSHHHHFKTEGDMKLPFPGRR